MYSTASANTQTQAEFYSTHQIDNTVTTIMSPLRGGVQSIADADDVGRVRGAVDDHSVTFSSSDGGTMFLKMGSGATNVESSPTLSPLWKPAPPLRPVICHVTSWGSSKRCTTCARGCLLLKPPCVRVLAARHARSGPPPGK